MKELKGDLFSIPCDAICISTNGFVKNNGECVMGRGCAKQAADYFPEIPKLLGSNIRANGNNVTHLNDYCGVGIVAFPVKPETKSYMGSKCEVVKHMQSKFSIGDRVPGWACVADIELIKKSAVQLVKLTDKEGWEKVLIPRVGAGYGELDWKDIKPVLDEILDDRFTSVTFK